MRTLMRRGYHDAALRARHHAPGAMVRGQRPIRGTEQRAYLRSPRERLPLERSDTLMEFEFEFARMPQPGAQVRPSIASTATSSSCRLPATTVPLCSATL